MSGPFINFLPRRAGIPFRERRLYARVALPEGFSGRLGLPTVELSGRAADIELTNLRVRHEVWGDRRYVNVQVESESPRLATPGAKVRLMFPVEER